MKNHSIQNYAYDPYIRNDLNSFLLDDVFQSNFTLIDIRESRENLIDESKRPCGNFTSIEGILAEALENIKRLKNQKTGNTSSIIYFIEWSVKERFLRLSFSIADISFEFSGSENQDTNNQLTKDTQKKGQILTQIEEKITEMIDGKIDFTLIMDDPASNSYLQVSLNNH